MIFEYKIKRGSRSSATAAERVSTVFFTTEAQRSQR
jgi:hypothetical protein